MEKEILDNVMQNILNINYNTMITKHTGVDDYIYVYDKNGLNCISHDNGYSCDYVIVGLLLEKVDYVTIEEPIDYKQFYISTMKFATKNDLATLFDLKQISKKCEIKVKV